jgi:hypothetical protein
VRSHPRQQGREPSLAEVFDRKAQGVGRSSCSPDHPNPAFPDAEALADDYCTSALGPSGVIVLLGDGELVCSRIHERQRSGGGTNTAHQGRSDAKLTAYTVRCNEVNTKAADYFRESGLPVLTLNAADSLSDNAARVRGFLYEPAVSRRP